MKLYLEEAETIAEYRALISNYEKNGFKFTLIKISENLAKIMQSQVRSEKIIHEEFDMGKRWNYEGVTVEWDEWEKEPELKIIDGKIYRRRSK